jgi:hypothetical protein
MLLVERTSTIGIGIKKAQRECLKEFGDNQQPNFRDIKKQDIKYQPIKHTYCANQRATKTD